MIPVDQEFLAIPGKQRGDCFRACVASILELPLEEVPHFVARGWPHSFVKWAAARNIEWASIAHHQGHPKGYAIAMGDGPRGHRHAVVVLDGRVVHDPHPSRAGLVTTDSYIAIGG